MAMKKSCAVCLYCREPGAGDELIAGHGTWCSNSKSPLFLRRVVSENVCDGFQARGKKAGLGMRLKVKGMSFVNRWMRRKK